MHASLLLVQAPQILTGMCMHTTWWSECLQQRVACYCSNTVAAADAAGDLMQCMHSELLATIKVATDQHTTRQLLLGMGDPVCWCQVSPRRAEQQHPCLTSSARCVSVQGARLSQSSLK